MSTSYSLVFPTTEDLDFKARRISDANEANFALIASTPNAATYVYNAGLASDTITVEAKRSHSNGTTVCSLRISTDIRKSVSETGEVEDFPVDAQLSWRYPGKVAPDITSIKMLIEHLIGFYAGAGLTGANGYPTGVIAEKIDRGVLVGLP